jgi:shikimate dehydrogenase
MADLDRSISAKTGLLGVIGHPIGHSLSPAMHNAALRFDGLDMVYLAFDVMPDDLAAAVGGMRALGFRGWNVTVPHKEAMVPLLDSLDDLAACVGAVNTVALAEGCLRGHNTDVAGFLGALHAVMPKGVVGARCLLAGAGGAARAVLAALASAGVGEVDVFNRTAERAHTLCELGRTWGVPKCTVVEHEGLAAAGAQANLLVNATTIGMNPAVKDSPFPVDILTADQAIIDLVYSSAPTKLVEWAGRIGARAVDGREMLVRQAACSYEIWTGRAAPVEVMFQHVASR